MLQLLMFLCPASLVLLFACGPEAFSAEEAAAECRVLLITGEDHPGHKWRTTTPALKGQLEKDTRLAIEVLDDLTQLGSTKLGDYDVVVMHFKNYDPKVPGKTGYDNLTQFVRKGGGLVMVHFACGAFQEFKEDFVDVAGRVWNPKLRAHDPFGKFQVEIVDKEHPITRGLDAFETTDELYTCLDGKTPIKVLAHARSKVDQKHYPMAFVLSYGKGRVFHCVLGHDPAALNVSDVATLLRRGTVWVAGLDAESKIHGASRRTLRLPDPPATERNDHE